MFWVVGTCLCKGQRDRDQLCGHLHNLINPSNSDATRCTTSPAGISTAFGTSDIYQSDTSVSHDFLKQYVQQLQDFVLGVNKRCCQREKVCHRPLAAKSRHCSCRPEAGLNTLLPTGKTNIFWARRVHQIPQQFSECSCWSARVTAKNKHKRQSQWLPPGAIHERPKGASRTHLQVKTEEAETR